MDSSNEQGKDKGKARAQQRENDPQHVNATSLTSRVAASAKGLAQDVFANDAPSSSGLNEVLASVQAGNDKSRPSETPSSTHWSAVAQSGSRSHDAAPTAGSSSSFRDQQVRGTADVEADHQAFMNSTASLEEQSAKGQIPEGTSWTSEYHTSTGAPDTDGAEVVSLLSSPTFMAETDAPTSDDESSVSLPPYQPATTSPQTLNPLNLIPDSILNASPGDESRGHFLRDWDTVLNSYSDEVWGDLLPLVKKARDEARAAESGASPQEGGALARLRMLVGHMKEGQRPVM
ncbi:MAG: monothiol glutaredoxin grx4 [Chaenotheca gracillima]|nr:MAG: monothiol glutaredoxin grx4 [Chaenotheca gracillima]